ncbi:50S ribosomal protein L24 [Eubacteriales bacterium OttesenSCG-928-M02]|nr:50S ribosomal protein L24 [Eubacteriales bacterium OttesenSCG-928-M02]
MTKKLHVKKDDTVVVISGVYKGKTGKVLRAMPKVNKVVVEGVNIATRHTKPRSQGDLGGIIKTEAPVYAAKVMLVCPKCDKGTRPAHKIQPDGTKVRVCKKCGAEID